jgi:20S proteasome alpha/beta subunit
MTTNMNMRKKSIMRMKRRHSAFRCVSVSNHINKMLLRPCSLIPYLKYNAHSVIHGLFALYRCRSSDEGRIFLRTRNSDPVCVTDNSNGRILTNNMGGVVGRRTTVPVLSLQRIQWLLLSLWLLLLLPDGAASIWDRSGGRYSYSLTTFDPTGKLGQVERAMEAARQGTPIVALLYRNHSHPASSGILLAAPQVLPDLFTWDDGTPRWARISPEIVLAHSGLAADGRVVVAAAQRLAQQHEYTFDESIDITLLLEELSLLFQEYTMKPASRPFGVSLVVAYVPRSVGQPALYRVDPSGHVEALGTMAVVHGNRDLPTRVREQWSAMVGNESTAVLETSLTMEVLQSKVVQVLRNALRQQVAQNGDDSAAVDDLTILTASLSRDGSNDSVFRIECHEPDM